MPIYEYICKNCNSPQEHLTTMSADAPPCLNCGEHALLKTISLFSVSTQDAESCACEHECTGKAEGGYCHDGGCCCG